MRKILLLAFLAALLLGCLGPLPRQITGQGVLPVACNLPSVTEGVSVNPGIDTCTATGATPPCTWSITGLPSSLTYSNGACIISIVGTPDAGTAAHSPYPLSVLVTDSGSNIGTASPSLTVLPGAGQDCFDANSPGTYTLTGNITAIGTCINVLAQNVVIDCAGYNIVGDNGSDYGIYSTAANTTVQNCNVSNFAYGIFYDVAPYSQVLNTTSDSTYIDGRGIYVESSHSLIISNSKGASMSGAGIWLNNSGSAWIENSLGYSYENLTNGTLQAYGIYLAYSDNQNLVNTTGRADHFWDDSYGIYDYDSQYGTWENVTGISNANSTLNSLGANLFQVNYTTIDKSHFSSGNTALLLTWGSQGNAVTNSVAASNSQNPALASSGCELHHDQTGNRLDNDSCYSQVGYGIGIFEGAYIYDGGETATFDTITNSRGYSASGRALSMAGLASNNNLSNDYFESNGTYGIDLETQSVLNNFTNVTVGGHPSTGVIVFNAQNNSFYGMNITISGSGNALTFAYNATNNSVAKSTVSAAGGSAVFTQYFAGETVANNSIVNSTLSSANGTVIALQGGTLNNVLQQNTVKGYPWIDNTLADPSFNNFTCNNYIYGNGTNAYDVFNILSTQQNGCADVGGDLPFYHVTVDGAILGHAYDNNPYTTHIITNLICGTLLNTPNQVLTLTQDAVATNGTCFLFMAMASNDTLDCNGYSIIGNNSVFNYAILSNATGTTIRNCNIRNFANGIWLFSSSSSIILNDTINTTTNSVLSDKGSPGIGMSRLNAYVYSGYGIQVLNPNGGSLVNSHLEAANLSASADGIWADSGNGMLVQSCDVEGFGNAGIHYTRVTNGTIRNNTVNAAKNGGIALQFNAASTGNTIANNKLYCQAQYTCLNAGSISTGNDFENNSVISNGSAGSAMYLTNGAGGNVFRGNLFECLLSGCSAVWLNVEVSSCSFTSNTFSSNGGIDLLIWPTAGNSTFSLNNFTGATVSYVNDSNGTNSYNSSANGTNIGNYWPNVLNGSVRIYGDHPAGNGLYYGAVGPGYPYSGATSQGGFQGAGADYAPLTPFMPANSTNLFCYVSPGVSPLAWPAVNPPSRIYIGARPLRQGIYGALTCRQNTTGGQKLYAYLNATLASTQEYASLNGFATYSPVYNLSASPVQIDAAMLSGAYDRIWLGRDYFNTSIPLLTNQVIFYLNTS